MHADSGAERDCSMSFVVTATDLLEHAAPNLATVRSRLREGDEVFVFTSFEAPKRGNYERDLVFSLLRSRCDRVCAACANSRYLP